MTVHMIRVVAAANSTDTAGLTETEINNAMDTWVANHSEWVADEVEHHIVTRNTEEDGSGTDYYVGSYRFEFSDAKSNLLTKCEDKLQTKVDWYRLGYHECDHDSPAGGCSWDDEREWTSKNTTSVPSGVPNFL